MKMIKCDRCRQISAGNIYDSYGTSSWYDGEIYQYSYGEEPRMNRLDLCSGCHAELKKIVNDWMKESDNADHSS